MANKTKLLHAINAKLTKEKYMRKRTSELIHRQRMDYVSANEDSPCTKNIFYHTLPVKWPHKKPKP